MIKNITVFKRAGLWGRKSLLQGTEHQCPQAPCKLALRWAVGVMFQPHSLPTCLAWSTAVVQAVLLLALQGPACSLSRTLSTISLTRCLCLEDPPVLPRALHFTESPTPASGTLIRVPRMSSPWEVSHGQNCSRLPGASPLRGWGGLLTLSKLSPSSYFPSGTRRVAEMPLPR